MDLTQLLAARPTRRFVFGAALLTIAVHVAVWAATSAAKGFPWLVFLDHWDSAWYSRIIRDGYGGETWAFLPLYPLLVKALALVTGTAARPQVVGVLFSTALFLGFCALIASLLERTPDEATAFSLAPATRLGWLTFVLSPASYVFHSHHTESLFLLLSAGAFLLAVRRRWLPAALVAGICSLTRVQGVFVAIVVALWAVEANTARGARLWAFVRSGLVSAALFALFPLYQYLATGDVLASFHANITWGHAEMSPATVLRSFWFGNPWQNTNVGSWLHHAFVLVLIGSIFTLRPRRYPWITLVVLNLIVFPFQGEFVDAFRFGTVIFPALFALGDRAARWPSWLILPAGAVMFVLNQWVAYNYVIRHWAY